MTLEPTTRRSILQGWLAATAVGFGMFALNQHSGAQAQPLPETPSCGPDPR